MPRHISRIPQQVCPFIRVGDCSELRDQEHRGSNGFSGHSDHAAFLQWPDLDDGLVEALGKDGSSSIHFLTTGLGRRSCSFGTDEPKPPRDPCRPSG